MRGAAYRKMRSKKAPNSRRISGICAALFYLFAIVAAAIALSGCSYSNSVSKSLYVAEIRRNASGSMSEIQLSVGYFGGCVTIVEPSAATSNTPKADDETKTSCIMNMYAHDADDLLEELVEDLKVSEDGALTEFLNGTLYQARHLQKNVFQFTVPLVQLALFVIGGAMLFVATTNIVPKKSYRLVVVLAFLCIVFAMGLMFAMAFGSLQALHGLVNEEDSKLPAWTINGNDSIHFADRLYFVQIAQAVMVILFANFMALMFVGGLRPKKKPERKGTV